MGTIDDCDVFREALNAFERASEDVRAQCAEESLRRAAVPSLDRTARTLVTAAADYYCAHTLLDLFTSLDALDRDQREANAAEQERR